jgi:hypothetical protein
VLRGGDTGAPIVVAEPASGAAGALSALAERIHSAVVTAV